MKIVLSAIVFALGLGAAVHADPVPTFELPSGTFSAPLPDGYCVPAGIYSATLDVLASADKLNKTDISFFSCSDMAKGALTSWGMIKTPLAILNGHAGSRATALAQVKATLDTEEGKKLLTLSDEDIKTKTNFEKVFGKDFTGTAKIDALDSDDNAIYFGGVANYDDGKGNKEKVACAYAMTVVRDNVFTLLIYKEFEDVSDIAALLKKVKPAVAAFIAANEG